jgi:hypothetical protein
LLQFEKIRFQKKIKNGLEKKAGGALIMLYVGAIQTLETRSPEMPASNQAP